MHPQVENELEDLTFFYEEFTVKSGNIGNSKLKRKLDFRVNPPHIIRYIKFENIH